MCFISVSVKGAHLHFKLVHKKDAFVYLLIDKNSKFLIKVTKVKFIKQICTMAMFINGYNDATLHEIVNLMPKRRTCITLDVGKTNQSF